jgi:hypothetical protein
LDAADRADDLLTRAEEIERDGYRLDHVRISYGDHYVTEHADAGTFASSTAWVTALATPPDGSRWPGRRAVPFESDEIDEIAACVPELRRLP